MTDEPAIPEPMPPAPQPPEESSMEIRPPKPWRGWRKFSKEYAIIVVGVATALAAGQTAETLHNRSRAAIDMSFGG